jgi:bifunctional DNase/RNase
MDEIELSVAALNASESAPGNFVLVLQEIKGDRQITVVIGLPEAQSIAVGLENVQPLRPLTHDLMLNSLQHLGASLEYVKISGMKDEVYTAFLAIKTAGQKMIQVDARASDAIALAIRKICPVRIDGSLLQTIAMENFTVEKSLKRNNNLADNSLQELYAMLSDALRKEDYENAGLIQTFIDKKENK